MLLMSHGCTTKLNELCHLVMIPLPHENMLGIGFQVVFAIQTCVISVAVNMTQTSIRKTLEEHLKRMLMSIQTYSLTH